jgi:hypothetical protein
MLAVATYFLTYVSLRGQRHGHTQIAIIGASVILGIAASIQFFSVSTRFLGIRRGTDKNIDAALKGQLVEFFKKRAFGRDIMDVSLHVWLVPVWYRRVFPYSMRLKLKHLTRDLPWFDREGSHQRLRPKLRRLGYEQFTSRNRSNINFKKGYGLIGHCLLVADGDGEKTRISYADLRGDFTDLVSKGKDVWNHDNSINKWGLEWEDAKILSGKYGQALAMPLRASTDEAVGCVTLSVPSSCTRDLFSGVAVREGLTTTREMIERLLRQDSDYSM